MLREGARLTQEGFLGEVSFMPYLGKGRARAKVNSVGRSVRIPMWEIMRAAAEHGGPKGTLESTKVRCQSLCTFCLAEFTPPGDVPETRAVANPSTHPPSSPYSPMAGLCHPF